LGKANGDMLERKFIETSYKGSGEINWNEKNTANPCSIFFHKNQSGKINYEIENGLDKIMKNKWGDQLE